MCQGGLDCIFLSIINCGFLKCKNISLTKETLNDNYVVELLTALSDPHKFQDDAITFCEFCLKIN